MLPADTPGRHMSGATLALPCVRQDPLNPLATPASHRPQKGHRIEDGQEGISEPESSALFSRLMHQVEQISITGDEIFGLGYQSQIDVWGVFGSRS
jgi:hypothetical protein